MQQLIDFGAPVLREDRAQALTPSDLDDFYASASEVDRLNLFFVLLSSPHAYELQNAPALAAHLSFLAAYYLFVPLTPPGSQDLALHYIKKAISLCDSAEYRQWLTLIEQGNCPDLF